MNTKKPLSPEKQARLNQEKAKQNAARERIEAMATDSLMTWVTKVLTPIVRKAVNAVIGWFSRLFGGGPSDGR